MVLKRVTGHVFVVPVLLDKNVSHSEDQISISFCWVTNAVMGKQKLNVE